MNVLRKSLNCKLNVGDDGETTIGSSEETQSQTENTKNTKTEYEKVGINVVNMESKIEFSLAKITPNQFVILKFEKDTL